MKGRRRELGALVMLVAALGSAAAAALVAVGGRHGTRPAVELALVVGLAVAAVVLGALGVHLLRAAPAAAAGGEHPEMDFRHARTVFVVVGAAIALALVARRLAVPEGFGAHGYYRGAAPFEAMVAREPRHVGEHACAACHADQVALHDKDAHAAVPCETCHGPGREHAQAPDQHELKRPAGKDWCLTCHRRLAARPGGFAQIRVREHYRTVGVAAEDVDCTRCHDPHEPLYMDRDLRTARLHPLIHRCRDCHVGRDDTTLKRPANHPAIFECSYCHADIARDFESKPHAGHVACTTCHVFVKESDFAGRIVRDADPRFCLLCHRQADFRGPGSPPGIEWPAHRDDMSTGPEDAQKRCIDCHQEDHIHSIGDKTHGP